MRGCHSSGTGRITAPGSSWPQSTRIVQRKRRPTSNVDSMMVLRARRGGTGSKYVTLRGGGRLGASLHLVLSGGGGRVATSLRQNDPVLLGVALVTVGFPVSLKKNTSPGGRGGR